MTRDTAALIIPIVSAFFTLFILFKTNLRLRSEEKQPLEKKIKWIYVVGAFTIWISGLLLLSNFFTILNEKLNLQLDARQLFCYADFFSNGFISLLLISFALFLKLHIFGKKSAFTTGIFYGFAAQLPVSLLMTLIQYIVRLIGPFPRGTELCEVLLEDCAEHAWLYWMTMISFSIISPLVEELLFRGFLQNFLVTKCGVLFGIIITSMLFSAIHYSSEQMAANVELLAAIFTLSCLFGWLYQKQKTLTAPLAMHMTNNAIALFFKTL
jgi:membrane protease YdiL (CAAX protease family)